MGVVRLCFFLLLFLFTPILVKKADQRNEARVANQRETESIVKELFGEFIDVAKVSF